MAWIEKSGKNSYRIRVSNKYADGKQNYFKKIVKAPEGMTEKQLQKWLNEQTILFQISVDKGEISAQSTTKQKKSNLTMSEFIDIWLEKYSSKCVRVNSHENHKWLSKRVIEVLGEQKIGKISKIDLQTFLNNVAESKRKDVRNGELSRKTVKEYKSFLTNIFKWAVDMEYLDKSPAVSLILPANGKPRQEKELYTSEQVVKIIKKLFEIVESYLNGNDKPYSESILTAENAIYFIMLYSTGARKSEISALKWTDIYFSDNVIDINKSLSTDSNGKTIISETKTKNSNRPIVVPNTVMRILEKYQAKQQAYGESIGNIWNGDNFVFTLYNGEPVGENRMYKWFRKFCERNDLPFKGIHIARHQIASMMLDNGQTIPEIANHLGHSSPNTTLSIYSHEIKLAEAKKRNVEKISEMLGIPETENTLTEISQN